MHPAAEHYCSGLEEIDYAVEAAETAPFRHGPSFEVDGVHQTWLCREMRKRRSGRERRSPSVLDANSGQCKYSPAAEAEIQCHKEILVSDTAETRDGHCVVRQTSNNRGGCVYFLDYLRKTYRLVTQRAAEPQRVMPRDDLLISLNEREFIVKALQEEELRVDGRGPFDTRPVSYRFGPKDGMCEVQLGDTRVLAVVSAKLEPPSGARGNEGTITINVEFSPMASPNFEPGRPGEQAQELALVLERAIRETGAVDVESLCVLAGRRVWHVRCDVHVLDACGNIAGAASLAADAALLSFRRPEATVSPDTQLITVHPADVREPVPLALHHLPVAITFGYFAEQDGLVIADPTVNEEMVIGSELVVVLNAHDELCAVRFGGEVAVNPSEISRCVRIASRISKDLTQDLKKAHSAWEVERDKRRVRRHYGAEAAANPDFGLPGRGSPQPCAGEGSRRAAESAGRGTRNRRGR